MVFVTVFITVVKTLRNVTRHFNVLDLVAPHRHFVRVEQQNIRRHQDGVHEQASRHVRIRVIAGRIVFVNRGFVGVGAVQHAFTCHAGQQPRQLRNFWDIRLAVKRDAFRIHTRSQP